MQVHIANCKYTLNSTPRTSSTRCEKRLKVKRFWRFCGRSATGSSLSDMSAGYTSPRPRSPGTIDAIITLHRLTPRWGNSRCTCPRRCRHVQGLLLGLGCTVSCSRSSLTVITQGPRSGEGLISRESTVRSRPGVLCATCGTVVPSSRLQRGALLRSQGQRS